MAPAEPMMPVDLASPGLDYHPIGNRRRSHSESENGIDMGASRGSIRSAGTNGSKTSWRGKFGLLGMARRTLGIILLLLTVFLWTVSNFLASVSCYVFPKSAT
jgi:solute carrier family 35 protein F5